MKKHIHIHVGKTKDAFRSSGKAKELAGVQQQLLSQVKIFERSGEPLVSKEQDAWANVRYHMEQIVSELRKIS